VANSFYFDASALAKRYVPETGSAQVDAVLDTVPARRVFLLSVGAGEIASIAVRKRNAGLLPISDFDEAMRNIRAEIVQAGKVTVSPVSKRLVFSSLPLIVAHSINSTEAMTLKSALAIARRLRAAGDDLVFVASDRRLLRAAGAEGLSTFNPESQDQAALALLLGP
jgi:predicted nucleic acid-binding protein